MIYGDNLIYVRIDWENYPSDKTPLNEYNLNKMDLAIFQTDERVQWLNENKFDKSDSFKLIKNIDIDEATGVFTITYYDDSTKKYDTLLEKIAINWDFDAELQQLIITLDDGTVKRIDLSALITQYEFMTSDTISFDVQTDGKIKAIVRDGSIQEKHLRPDYLADIRLEEAKVQLSKELAENSAQLAESKAEEAANSAIMAKSYSNGDTGIRTGEETDNSKYYSEQSKNSSEVSRLYLEKVEQAGNEAVDKINNALDMDVPDFLVDLSTGHLMYSGGRFDFNVNETGHLEWGLAV